MASPNFIPVDLRALLRADAEQAKKNGDAHCASRLEELADNPGYGVSLIRKVGLQACTIRYPSAKELMRLVRLAEAEEAGR